MNTRAIAACWIPVLLFVATASCSSNTPPPPNIVAVYVTATSAPVVPSTATPEPPPSPTTTLQREPDVTLERLEQIARGLASQPDAQPYSLQLARLKRLYGFAPDPTPRPSSTPRPPSPAAVCRCDYNAYNCADFRTHDAAQACYRYCISVSAGDVHWLDDDDDGIACELLP